MQYQRHPTVNGKVEDTEELSLFNSTRNISFGSIPSGASGFSPFINLIFLGRSVYFVISALDHKERLIQLQTHLTIFRQVVVPFCDIS
jgi:hypothetical protein